MFILSEERKTGGENMDGTAVGSGKRDQHPGGGAATQTDRRAKLSPDW